MTLRHLAYGDGIIHDHDNRIAAHRCGGLDLECRVSFSSLVNCRGDHFFALLFAHHVHAFLGQPQTRYIQDQHHAAIAENGRATEPFDARQLRAQRLDHDFARASEAVHLNGDLTPAAASQQYRYLAAGRGLRIDAQTHRKVHERVDLILPVEYRPAAHLNTVELLDRHFEDVHHRRQRNGVQLFADAHHECLADGQRERQADDERGANTAARVHGNRPAKLLHFVVHHIHADTATR